MRLRSALALLLTWVAVPPVEAQPALTFVGSVQLTTSGDGVGGSDVWAYTAPDGSEYALMGDATGVRVVAVPSMAVVASIPGPTSGDYWYHRDIKTRGAYAFIVTECFGTNQGLQVVDLSGLPDAVQQVAVLGGSAVSSHNLSVDVATGYAYVLNSGNSNLQIVDVRTPTAPAVVGTVPTGDLHDVVARNDTLWVAEGYQGAFSMWDVRDKQAPVRMGRWEPAGAGYAHNIWPTDDGRYALTTEETQGRTVKVWDLADPADAALVGEYLGPNGLAHNAHVAGRYAFVSHYGAGVVVVDLQNPAAPAEVARYDTYPASDAGGFRGNWGTIPPTPGGYVYASDIEGGLTVFQWTTGATANEPAPAAPAVRLEAPAPNPAYETTTLRFTLDEAAAVRLAVYDVLGREMTVAAEGPRAAGTHAIALDVAALPPGVYVVRLEAAGQARTQRLSVVG